MEHLVRRHYLECRRSCAHTLILTGEQLWGIQIADLHKELIESYAELLKRDDLCSAYSGSIALLYHLISTQTLHTKANMAAAIGGVIEEFFGASFGGHRCSSIRLHHAKQDVRCLYVITETVKTMHELVQYML